MRNYPYDSFDSVCKTPFGAVPAGSIVRFSVLLSDFSLPLKCELLLYRADEFDSPARYRMDIQNEFTGYNRFSCAVPLPEEPYLYFYNFEVTDGAGTHVIRRIDSHNGDFVEEGGELWQLTVYSPNYQTPDPPTRGIIYQIFPDRFADSGSPKQIPEGRQMHQKWKELPEFRPNMQGEITNSDYFGGDLRGIAEKLPYLQTLGVSLIYLNPIFEAHSNHRYNVADYTKVDPLLGTNEDFEALCEEAASRGIGIILDGVFSHTGSDSVYFNKERRYGDGGAFNDPNSPYKEWYKFNNWPNDYHSWWGFNTLPEIIEENPGFLDFITGENGIIRQWMRRGAAGFRLDVADELPDIILDKIRKAVKEENPNGILIGEVWEDASNKVAYSQRRRYLLGDQLDSVMNYPYMNAVIRFVRYGDSAGLYHTVLSILENYPAQSVKLLFNSLSTHDTPRAITLLAGDEYTGGDREWQAAHHNLSIEQYGRGRALLLIAYTLLYFLPGTPTLYYGDETGAHGWRDPFNRTPYPWGEEDTDLINHFQKLGRLYRENGFLANANYVPVTSTNDVFVYSRMAAGRSLTVAVNRGPVPTDLSAVISQGEVKVIVGSFDNGWIGPLSSVVILR